MMSLVSLTTPVIASAKTSNASVQADLATMREQLRRSQQQVDALQAQVSNLQSKIDSQAVAQSTAAADAQAALAKADQALGQAAMANGAVAAQAQRPAALPDSVKWAANTSISGRMYFNASNISQKSNGIAQTSNGTGFKAALYRHRSQIRRHLLDERHDRYQQCGWPYLEWEFQRRSRWAADYNLVGRGFYVKKAYLQAKLDPALIVRLGAADLPWVPRAEVAAGFAGG